MENAEIGDWQVQVLRLSAFLTSTARLERSDWWERVVGQLPENTVSQPKLHSVQASGPFGSGKLTFQGSLVRMDWLLSPADPGELLDRMPILGAFVDVVDGFAALMKKWLEMDIPDIIRLAFGAILLRPVSDKRTGYKDISGYLPFALDPDNSSDFMYQINRPRISQVIDGLLVNRLSKWSVARWQIAIAGGQPGATRLLTEGEHESRLELDINTDAERQEQLARNSVSKLFNELLELGKEIATDGDKP